MIELWHCADARSFRPLWALEELELPYTLHLLPFPPRFRQPEYLDENPLGTVPLLVAGATRMTESAAMLEYLASRVMTPLVITPDEADYGAYLDWLHRGEATLTFPQTIVLRYRVLEPVERRLPQAADDYAQWFFSRLRSVDRALADGRDWLVGARFTMADISVAYALLLAGSLGLDTKFPPAVAAYWQRCAARPGFGRAKAAQQR